MDYEEVRHIVAGGESDGVEFKRSTGERTEAAKTVCAGCPVRLKCADCAIRAREPYGVWGGLTEEEREVIYAAIDDATGDPRAYPRERGAGLRLASQAIDSAVLVTRMVAKSAS